METLGQKLFQDIPAEEREQMLEANCLRPEEMELKKFFEADEIVEMRKQFFDNATAMRKATEELNKAKEIWKTLCTPLESDNKYLMASIRTGFVEVKQQVYLFDDQENGFMMVYDSKGGLITSRRLEPHERQTRIKGE